MEKTVINQIYSNSVQDFTFWGMFCGSTFFVKLVIVVLLGLSIYSWTIMISKYIYLKAFHIKATKFYRHFYRSETLLEIYNAVHKSRDLYSRIFITTFDELRGQGRVPISSRHEMNEAIDIAARIESFHIFNEMWKHLGILASIGSVTPFIGLLGTVWGIMDSFQSIGVTKNASLAVVAPGIAEALFTTALGLIVTIPAVIGYNKINAVIQQYSDQMDNYLDQLKDLFSKVKDA